MVEERFYREADDGEKIVYICEDDTARGALYFFLRNELPTIEEQDGIQKRTRTFTVTELTEREHLSINEVLKQADPDGRAEYSELVALSSHRIVKTLENLLGDYRGLDSTIVRQSATTADTWEIDRKESNAAVTGALNDGERPKSLRQVYSRGEINRLSALGHAVTAAIEIERLKEGLEKMSPAQIAIIAVRLGFAMTSSFYKPHERLIEKQTRAAERSQAATKGRGYWLDDWFNELLPRYQNIKKATRKAMVEMTQEPDAAEKYNYIWPPMNTEAAIRRALERHWSK